MLTAILHDSGRREVWDEHNRRARQGEQAQTIHQRNYLNKTLGLEESYVDRIATRGYSSDESLSIEVTTRAVAHLRIRNGFISEYAENDINPDATVGYILSVGDEDIIPIRTDNHELARAVHTDLAAKVDELSGVNSPNYEALEWLRTQSVYANMNAQYRNQELQKQHENERLIG